MPAAAQALRDAYIAEIRASGRNPQLLDYAYARRHAAEVQAQEAANAAQVAARDPYGFGALLAELRALEPANDDPELDALLAGLDEAVPADEPAIIMPANDDLPASPKPGSDASLKADLVTRKRGARLAKSGLRDREDAAARRAYRRSNSTAPRTARRATKAQPTNPTPHHTHTHSPIAINTTTPPTPDNENHAPKKPNTSKGKPGRKKTSRARFMAGWDDAGEPTHIDYVNRAMMLRGRPYEISLHLSHDRIAAANENERGPLDDLWREINRQLAKALPDFDPALWIVLETTKDTARLHIHGGIAVTHPRQLQAIREALRAAGGAWEGIGGQFQLRCVPQRRPDTWAAYATKSGNLTREHLREALGLTDGASVKIASWSRSLLRDAKRLLEEERRAIGRK